jgi:hypothetical protein
MTFVPLSDLELHTIYNHPLDPIVILYSRKMPLQQHLAMGLSNLSMYFFKTFFCILYVANIVT